MIRYVIKRLLWLIPVIICVTLIVFVLMDLAPGTIVDAIHSDEMTAEDRATLIAKYDLDKPLIYRYGKYMLKLIQGDLGVSDKTGLPIWKEFITKLPKTIELSFLALVIGAVVSIPLGIVSARKAGTLIDNGATLLSLVGLSMPLFWLGLLLMLFFSHRLGWLPATGDGQGFKSIILPAVCSSVSMMAQTARQTRSNMLEVLSADYLRTARAKGVPEKIVIRRHALGNAWIPILTALGAGLSSQLAGSVVVETTFAWPGIGRMAAEAVLARDVTKTCGVVIMTTILYVLVQLIVDLMYAFVDPRIKAQYISAGKGKKRSSKSTKAVEAPATSVLAAEEVVEQTAVTAAASVPAPAVVLMAKEEPAQNTAPVKARKSFVTRDLSAESIKNTEAADVVNDGKLVVNKYKKRSQFGSIMHSLRKNKGSMVGGIILAILLLVFIGSLFIKFETVIARNASDRFTSPNGQYPFGTDGLGRNMLYNVIYGIRYSLAIGFGAAGISTVLGVTLGSIAGYYGGALDNLIMRFSDVVASIPGLLFGMVIVTTLGQSLGNLIIAVGVTGMPIFIRMTRASILTVKNNEYVEASKSIGLPNLRIIFSQVLPNGLSPVIVTVTASLGVTIIVAASLSYLGFGVPAPHPEWGRLIAANKEFARSASWLMTFPGLAIMLTVLAFNMLGDGLRDALDPKQKR